jgi:hypothetical protein
MPVERLVLFLTLPRRAAVRAEYECLLALGGRCRPPKRRRLYRAQRSAREIQYFFSPRDLETGVA